MQVAGLILEAHILNLITECKGDYLESTEIFDEISQC